MLQSPIRTSPKILIMKVINEILKIIVTTGYCLHIILFGPNLIKRLPLDVPTTELRPKHKTALNPSPRLVCPIRRPFKYFQRHENIQRNELYLQSFFNYAINIIFASFTIRPLYSRERNHWISVCVSLDDVASCGLYFLSVSTFWHVFYCQLKCWMCLQNLPGFLYQFRRSTTESKSSGCGFPCKDKSFTTGL